MISRILLLVAGLLAVQSAAVIVDVNLSLTDGGPFRSTELATLNIFREAFQYQRFETARTFFD